MRRLVTSTEINKRIVAPASKSQAQRALIAALLTNGKSRLNGITYCDDTVCARNIIRSWGAELREIDGDLEVVSSFAAKEVKASEIYCGESGLLARMMIPFASLFSGEITITGSGSLLSRPIGMAERPLKELNVSFHSANGYLPLRVGGPLTAGKISLDGSLSSQLLTGLLMMLPLAENDSEILVPVLKSKPYIDLTLDVLKHFGITVEHDDYAYFRIPGGQHYSPAEYRLEGDWSAASLLLVAGCLAGNMSVSNLRTDSFQPDRRVLEVLERAAATYNVKNCGFFSEVTTTKSELTAFDYDATETPDLFPALAALATACSGESRIRGVHRLKHKESDRGMTLLEEFSKLGILIRIEGDELCIKGGKVGGGVVSSHRDHRIAMALAAVALRAEAPVLIEDSEVVNKSYPAFWDDFLPAEH